jgi:carboxyl-terminal processing protease
MLQKSFAALLLLNFITGVWHTSAQERDCDQIKYLVASAQKFHVAPFQSPTELNARVKELLFADLDPKGIHFTQDQINAFQSPGLHFEHPPQKPACAFVQSVAQTFTKQVKLTIEELKTLRTKELSYDGRDSARFSFRWAKGDVVFSASEEERLKHIEKEVKMRTLMTLFFEEDSMVADKWGTVHFGKSELKARQSLIDRKVCQLDRLLGEAPQYVMETFLNSILKAYDPHSTYLSTESLSMFANALSKDHVSYGIEVNEENAGELEIVRVIPGTSAWKTNKVTEGDVVLKVRFGNRLPQEVTCENAAQLIGMISVPIVGKIELTVKKQDGRTEDVTLYGEKVETEENQIVHLVLKGKKNIGYISLPSFYTSMEGEGMPGCANDVATSILSLEAVGIDGLILDLRDNGGGSMKEAKELAGIFVDRGTVAISHQSGSAPELLKDPNRGVLTYVPLIIMVDGLSASASELVTAALQEHRRALIIGSSTFGKATVQRIMPIDAARPSVLQEAEAFIKLTIERFYDPKGKTHQGTGVEPDILLPTLVEHLVPSERGMKYMLPNVPIDKKGYYEQGEEIPIGSLRTLSEGRTKQNPYFERISSLGDSMQILLEPSSAIPLAPRQFADGIESYGELLLMFGEGNDFQTGAYEVTFTDEVKLLASLSTDWTKVNEELTLSLQGDRHLEEAYHVMLDWLTVGK